MEKVLSYGVILPVKDGGSLHISEGDVKIEFYRGSGPGGQHRNTTFSGVRIRHLPTGIVVHADENRSQARNREVAWLRLQLALERRLRKAKKRVATAVPNSQKEKRLKEKRLASQKKKQRSNDIDR